MYMLGHVRFSFQVKLVSDCHIGDGKTELLSTLRNGWAVDSRDQQGVSEPRVATIARDFVGWPILPSTALKGALRKRLECQLTKQTVETMFGAIKSDDQGAMGQFSFYPGKRDASTQQDVSGLPYWDAQAGTWIATHVAISRQTGAADHQKLYNEEMLPIGTVFDIDGVWLGDMEAARKGLAILLSPLATKDGLNVGGGQKLGLGAIRFSEPKDQVLLVETRFAPETGEVVTVEAGVKLTFDGATRLHRPVELALVCNGPFASVDPARVKGSNHAKANRIATLKRNSQTPVLHSHTLAGALRARTAWLAQCEGLGGDNRFRKPSTWSTPNELTSVERLFGVGGWRGLLRISQPGGVSEGKLTTHTSIAIDRFSGAVLDSALFEYEVFTGVKLDVSLVLETRTHEDGQSYPSEDDKRLFRLLLDDIDSDILMLGHATNRGFGWFDVIVKNRAQMQENT